MSDWRVLSRRVIFAMLGLGGSLALAQVAPSTAEVARYTGLHAAAHSGDMALLENDRYDAITPLQLAQARGHTEMVLMLKNAGAH